MSGRTKANLNTKGGKVNASLEVSGKGVKGQEDLKYDKGKGAKKYEEIVKSHKFEGKFIVNNKHKHQY